MRLRDWTCLLPFAALLAACATTPPQVRPTTPDAFLGEWEGTWASSLGPSGAVEATINPMGNALQLLAKYTDAVVPGFGAEAKFVNGELVVEQPISMVIRLHGNDRLEASYYNNRNNSRGTWSLVRKEKPVAKAEPPTAQLGPAEMDFVKKLVDGSPWRGEFGSQPSGTLGVTFARSGGEVTGTLDSISAGTACPGALGDLRVKGDKLSFRTPCNNVYVELELKGEKLEGGWYGSSSGWLSLTPSR